MDLITDIGATNSRCALVNDGGQIVATEVFSNSDFYSIEALFKNYLQNRRESDRPRRAALAVTAPVLRDRVEMVNIDWQFSQAELQARLNLTRLIVLNDAAAIAWGIPNLGSTQLRKVGDGDAAVRSPVAVIGPGSGLGVAALIPAGDDWAAVAGEGGHVSISPITARETAVVEYVSARSGHCSAEDLLSGPGLVNTYSALQGISAHATSTLTPAEVTAAADAGDPVAVEARGLFCSLLGTVAGNLALTVGAHGGVFVAGGIVPKIIEAFLQSDFRERFEDKGDYREYMRKIPTFVVTDPHPAFQGLRKLLGFR